MSQFWANVGVDIGTLGTSQVVSAVSKANPGVATYVGTDPLSGDYIAVTAAGMRKINNRVFRAANVNSAGNTLELEGENTTAYDTFLSGALQPITWPNAMTTVRGVSSSGGEAKTTEDSTIHDSQDIEAVVGTTALRYTMDNRWSVTDPALLALKAAGEAGTVIAVRFRFADSSKIAFLAKVSAPLLPQGNAGQIITTQVVLYVQGAITPYAS